jgi:hypothetical protein
MGSTHPREYNWGATRKKSSGSGLEIRDYCRRDPSRWPRGTLYPQKLALTSPTSGGLSVGIIRSPTQTTVFGLFYASTVPFSSLQSLLPTSLRIHDLQSRLHISHDASTDDIRAMKSNHLRWQLYRSCPLWEGRVMNLAGVWTKALPPSLTPDDASIYSAWFILRSNKMMHDKMGLFIYYKRLVLFLVKYRR